MIDYKIKLYSDIEPSWWDEQVKKFNGSIFYTYSYIKYMELCNKQTQIKNLSYVIFDKNKILSLVIIFIENIQNQMQMSVGEYSIQSPLINNKLSLKELDYIKSIIKKNIIELCKKHNCKLARFQVSSFNILTNSSYYKNFYYNWGFSKNIQKKEWYDFQCNQSFIIDLKLKEEILRANIRKSYKSLINKTEKSDVELHIINSENINIKLFDEYGKIHNKVKSNKRSKENLNFNLNLIKENKETIFLCVSYKKIIGAFVVLHYNNMAYYNSGYINNDKDILHPTHYLFWQAIKYLHKKEYQYFHIGSKIDNSLSNLPSKHINLSFFKSGWGGTAIGWEHAEKLF